MHNSDKPIFRIEGPEIVEQPTMKEPKTSDFYGRKFSTDMDSFDYRSFNEAVSQYKKHLASLRRYPHNLPDSLKGVDLIEGKHFRLQEQWLIAGKEKDLWYNTEEMDAQGYRNYKLDTRIVALPISQPEQPKDASKYKVQLPDVTDQDGIQLEWLKIWEQVLIWYGDIKKKESARDFLLRLQTEFPIAVKNEQPISEEGTYTKWSMEGNTIFFIDDLKELVRQVNEKKLMWSKFCEILNMKVFERYHSTPSQEAIEFGQWLADTNWGDTLLKKDPPIIPSMKQLYQLYTEHKNSNQ